MVSSNIEPQKMAHPATAVELQKSAESISKMIDYVEQKFGKQFATISKIELVLEIAEQAKIIGACLRALYQENPRHPALTADMRYDFETMDKADAERDGGTGA